MKNNIIVFFKDEEKLIIDEENTNKYFKKTNELFQSIDPGYKDLVSEVIEEISTLYKLALEDKGTSKPKSVTPIAGIKPKMFNDLQVEEMKELRNKGLSYRKIARIMGSSEKTIRNYLKE